MRMVFIGVDKPSGNTLFQYPCRLHQISFKPDAEMHASVAKLQEGDFVEFEISVVPEKPQLRNVAPASAIPEAPAWKEYVAYAILSAGALLAGYGLISLVKNFV